MSSGIYVVKHSTFSAGEKTTVRVLVVSKRAGVATVVSSSWHGSQAVLRQSDRFRQEADGMEAQLLLAN